MRVNNLSISFEFGLIERWGGEKVFTVVAPSNGGDLFVIWESYWLL